MTGSAPSEGAVDVEGQSVVVDTELAQRDIEREMGRRNKYNR